MAAVKTRRGPSIFAILFAILAVAIAATWVVPSGSYATVRYDKQSNALVVERGESSRALPATQASLERLGVATPIGTFTSGAATKPVTIPNTYRPIAATPQSPLALVTAPVAGAMEAADIFFFVLVIGGFVAVFNRSGAFDAGIGALTRTLAGREWLLVVVLTLLFGLGGTFEGMAEETIAFYPLLVPAFLAAGYDRIVPLAVILGGSQFGTLASTVNPFAVIIASAIAGVRWTEGLGVRIIVWLASMALLIAWTLFYARRVRRDPARSLAPADSEPLPATAEMHGKPRSITPPLALQLLLFGGTFVVMIVGVAAFDWWFGEMSALFLGAAIVAGLLQKGEGRIDTFIDGARALLGVALIIVLARAVSVVLASGHIDATILYDASNSLAGTPRWLFVTGAFGFYMLLSLAISSTSSMAVLTMPLMAPLGASVGVGAATVVSIYLFGMNALTVLSPTGLVLPSLAIAGVGYAAWARFAIPLSAAIALVALATLLIAG